MAISRSIIVLASSLLLATSAVAQRPARIAELPRQPRVEPGAFGGSPFSPAQHDKLRLPLALGGYCVVTLRDQQQWVAGQPQVQLIFDGKIYRFARPRQRDVFAAAPIHYVPALGGDCVVTYVETGRRQPGGPQYALLHGRRLYFFAGVDERETFRAAPGRYADADLANDGNCLVSRVDDQRQLPGMPETALLVDGLRYQFAGSYQRARFASNMLRYGVARTAVMRRDGRRSVRPPQPLLPGETQRPIAPSGQRDQDSPDDVRGLSKSVGDRTGDSAAMGGYCAVSIREQGIWVRGEAKYALEFAGKIFHFVGEEEKARFLNDPDEYLPALAGDCVVSRINTGRRVPGSVFHPVTYLGRLYLFAGPEQKETFRTEPTTYANADLAAGGNCAVTRAEEGRGVAGSPEWVVWHGGMRYFFATADRQAKFVADPERYTQVSMPLE